MAETPAQVLRSIIDTSHAWATIIINPEGGIIEAVGNLENLDLKTIGSGAALLFSGAESVCQELEMTTFYTITLEVINGLIICACMGNALLVVVAPDSRAIHLSVKRHLPRLMPFYR